MSENTAIFIGGSIIIVTLTILNWAYFSFLNLAMNPLAWDYLTRGLGGAVEAIILLLVGFTVFNSIEFDAE